MHNGVEQMNIANIITTIRFVLIPVFLFVFFSDLENAMLFAFLIFLAAGLTDVLDGYIARKFDMITKWGSILDPLADKLMSLTVLISLTIKGVIPLWVPLIIGAKEALMITGAAILFKSGAYVSAESYGKFATVMFYISILTLEFIYRPLGLVLIYTTVFFALYALYKYYKNFRGIHGKTQ